MKAETEKKVVLVGTYKGDQLTRWRGWYNWPISDSDFNAETQSGREGRAGSPLPAAAVGSRVPRDRNGRAVAPRPPQLPADFSRINELWLFQGTKDQRTYKAEFIGIKTREELIRDYGYPEDTLAAKNAKSAKNGRAVAPRPPKPHGTHYALFKTEFLYCHKNVVLGDAERVIVRTKDFVRSPKVRKQLKAYLESPDRNDPDLANRLPSIITRLRPEQLRVCEAAVQLEFVFRDEICPIDRSWHVFPKKNRDVQSQSLLDTLLSDAPNTEKRFTHIDCFSGVGGFCTGLHAAGFETKVAIEKVKSCVDTYTANHPEVHVINNDITKVSAEDILPYCPDDGIDLVTSGMPCETFSTAGNTSRSFYDERQFLFREGIRVAQITNAKYILFENVPGITSKMSSKGGKTLIIDILKEELVAAGYANFIEVVLDAAKFGVPQSRKRYFVLGTRLIGKRLLRPISRLKRTYSVADALEGLPPVVPNTWTEGREYQPSVGEYARLMRDERFWHRGLAQTNHLSYHMPMRHRPATLERFSLLRAGESLRDLFARYCGEELKQLQSRHVLPNKIFIKRNYRLPLTSPSPTVTSHCLDEFVHPRENRALTVRECARIQSFPDSYDFAGGPYIVPHINRDVQDKYEQIGDAVPPLLAYAWGKTIFKMLMED